MRYSKTFDHDRGKQQITLAFNNQTRYLRFKQNNCKQKEEETKAEQKMLISRWLISAMTAIWRQLIRVSAFK